MMGHQSNTVPLMLTRSLKGNMLSFYVALSLDLPEQSPLIAPWDAWECDLLSEGREFGPFDATEGKSSPFALLAIMQTVTRWKLSSRPLGDDKWLVESADGQSYFAGTLLHAYALAIVGGVFGEEVPDWYEDRSFKKNVFLPPYNVPYGELGPGIDAPGAMTFVAPAKGSLTYSEALKLGATMTSSGQAFKYTCDGHSWVQVQLMDGSVKPLYSGESTIGFQPSTLN